MKTSTLKFVWNCSEKQFQALKHDHKECRNGSKLSRHAGFYGSVSVYTVEEKSVMKERLKFDITHTLDTDAWYPFVNGFVFGVDECYGYHSDGTPYTIIANDHVSVPVRCKTLESFKKHMEKSIIDYISNENMMTISGHNINLNC